MSILFCLLVYSFGVSLLFSSCPIKFFFQNISELFNHLMSHGGMNKKHKQNKKSSPEILT